MAINPLQLPAPVTSTPIDFSAFNKIGDAIGEYKRRQSIGDAQTEATDANGNLDQAKFGAALMSRGLSDEARPILALAQQNAALQQTTAHNLATEDIARSQLAQTGQHQTATEGLARDTLDETKREHDIAANAPIASAPGTVLINKSTGQPIYKNDEGLLPPEAVDQLARQARAGDSAGVFVALNRGGQAQQNAAAVKKRMAELAIENGETGTEQAQRNSQYKADSSGLRTIANTNANIEYAANTANRAIDLAAESIKNVPRGQFVPFNRLRQMVDNNMSSPAQADLYAKTNTLVNEYARFTSPKGQPTDSQRAHAWDMLNTAMGPDAYMAVLNAMRQEIASGKAAGADTRRDLSGTIGGGQQAPGAPAAQPSAAPTVPPPPPRGFQLVK